MKNDVQHRQAAKKFFEYWTFRRGSEKGEDQQFWNSLLRDVLGVADVEQCIKYQVPVPIAGGARFSATATTKFLDAWIAETRVLIEHKSRGIDLDAPRPCVSSASRPRRRPRTATRKSRTSSSCMQRLPIKSRCELADVAHLNEDETRLRRQYAMIQLTCHMKSRWNLRSN